MKLWQKIYLFSTLLLIFTLNVAGLLLIQRFHTRSLKNEVDKCINQQQIALSELSFNANLMSRYSTGEPFNLERSISSLMSPYEKSGDNGFYQILDTHFNVIYTDSNFPISNTQEELEGLSPDITHYIIRPINDQYYLYISQLSQIHNIPIIIYYAKDLTTLYNEKYHYYTFFIKLDLLICCLFAIFMFFISQLITQPINTLIRSTNKITSGEYSERVHLHSKDEFKILANDFNLMAQTIEDKIRDLEISNENKETFINNFTHELKTPLTSIIGYANLMRTSKYNEEVFMLASNYIYSEGKRLEQMAFKMMDLIYAKSQQITLAPEDLLTVVIDAKNSFEPKLLSQSIELKVEGTSTILMLDKMLIHMLLTNLIENAIKASKPHSTIEVSIVSSDKGITLLITDHGIGIPPEHLSALCDPFYVVDKARSRANNGAGIGLSICQQIVTLHQATLNITSEVGQGTTVSILFPTVSNNCLNPI